jgi:hypothetical protein
MAEGTIFQSKIAEWLYYLGCVSAAMVIVYRVLWFAGANVFGAPCVVPHNVLDLSILMFVVLIASNARAVVHPEDGKSCCSGQGGVS